MPELRREKYALCRVFCLGPFSSAGRGWIPVGGAAEPARPCGGNDALRAPSGLARSGQPDAARAEIAKLTELREKLIAAKDAYWAEQVDIQRQVATPWVLYAEGKHDEALKAMTADAEDKSEKHPVTPGLLTPARELYGTMLLESGKPKEALAAFEATLKKEPHRLGATLGAAAAADKTGDAETARRHYTAAVALTECWARPAADRAGPRIRRAKRALSISPLGIVDESELRLEMSLATAEAPSPPNRPRLPGRGGGSHVGYDLLPPKSFPRVGCIIVKCDPPPTSGRVE